METQINDNICVPVLGKQITGLVIASVIFFFFGGPLIVLLGALTFADAWVAGVYKKNVLPLFSGQVVKIE